MGKSAEDAILDALLYVESIDLNSDSARILIGKIIAIWEAIQG